MGSAWSGNRSQVASIAALLVKAGGNAKGHAGETALIQAVGNHHVGKVAALAESPWDSL